MSDRGKSVAVRPRRKDPPSTFHSVEPGKKFQTKNGMIACARAGSADSDAPRAWVVVRAGSTAVFEAYSHGEVEKGANATVKAGGFATFRFGSCGLVEAGGKAIKHYGSHVKVEDGAEVMEIADDEQHLPPGHIFTTYAVLPETERTLVDMAKEASKKAYCPHSKISVGASVYAENASGERAFFWGANLENGNDSVDAERTALIDAVRNGFTKLLLCAVYAPKSPGGSPGPTTRFDLREFGMDATILNVFNENDVVVKFTVRQLWQSNECTCDKED